MFIWLLAGGLQQHFSRTLALCVLILAESSDKLVLRGGHVTPSLLLALFITQHCIKMSFFPMASN